MLWGRPVMAPAGVEAWGEFRSDICFFRRTTLWLKSWTGGDNDLRGKLYSGVFRQEERGIQGRIGQIHCQEDPVGFEVWGGQLFCRL